MMQTSNNNNSHHPSTNPSSSTARRGGRLPPLLPRRAPPPPRMFLLVLMLILASVGLLLLRPPRPVVSNVIRKYHHDHIVMMQQQQQQKNGKDSSTNDPVGGGDEEQQHHQQTAKVAETGTTNTRNPTATTAAAGGAQGEVLWEAAHLYWPISDDARRGFEAYELRLQRRLRKQLRNSKPPSQAAALLSDLWRVGDLLTVASIGAGSEEEKTTTITTTADWALVFAPPQPTTDTATTTSTTCWLLPQLAALRNVTLNQSYYRHECLARVPECEFFERLGIPLALSKCCSEHQKMRATLQHVHDRVAMYNNKARSTGGEKEVQLFADSGTLLSLMRDGPTLVPWETDIDLGLVGSHPSALDRIFGRSKEDDGEGNERDDKAAVEMTTHRSSETANETGGSSSSSLPLNRRSFWFERCDTKGSSDRCRDAHYVYYASTAQEAKRDTSRVEIWPFHEDQGAAMLRHPTRSWLDMPFAVVTPLQSFTTVASVAQTNNNKTKKKSSLPRPCALWGIPLYCPNQPVRYLDLEYPEQDWRRPRTIHWGERNVMPWG